MAFKGESASLDFLNLGSGEISLSLRGDLRFADLNAIDLALTANQAVIDQAPRPGGGCINEIKISPLPAGESVIGNTDRIAFRGGLLGNPWTVALTDHRPPSAGGPAGPAGATRSFPLCLGHATEGMSLLFGCEPRLHPKPEMPRPRRKSKRR